MIRLKNLNGTTHLNCRCGSWLAHWQNFSNEPLPVLCPEVHCRRKPEAGAHVQRADSPDASWYIIPLCAEHNARLGQTITVSEMVRLVSANTATTCR